MRTYCRICEAACGLVVVPDPVTGEPARLVPDREHPTSRGYACAKGTRFLEVARHPDRLLAPRLHGEDTTWEAATSAIASRLRDIRAEHGPHAVGVYFGNPLAFNALGFLATLAFVKALDTRNVFYAGSQDCNNKFAGADIVHGSPVIQAFPDFQHCELAVVFGSNPYVSQSSFIHLEGGGPEVFGGIVERGGHIVWVDPRRTESAKKWGEHLAIRPGTDAWLLFALLQILGKGVRATADAPVDGLPELLSAAESIDLDDVAARTGISRGAIEALAARIGASRATALHMSVGVNQGGFGTLAYVLVQALAWVTGNYDRPGGLLVNPTSRWVDHLYRWAGLDTVHRSRVGAFPSNMGTLPGGILADEILAPGPERIRALVVIAGDPLRSIPGSTTLARALEELDLLVSIDMFENATGRLAHALLPSASWLERWDFALSTMTFQQTRLVQVSGRAMAPIAQSRTDARIVADLAIAMGLPGLKWSLLRSRIDRVLPRPRFGVSGLRLVPGRWLAKNRLRLWDTRVATEVERLKAHAPEPDDGSFTLICRRRRLGHNSWLHGGVRSGEPESVAWMRADDLARLGVAEGGAIEIASAAGRIRIGTRAVEGLAARTVVVPHGLPELNVNELIPAGADAIERVSGQLTMTGIRADVRPA
jgi:anaerobic selenocysteine-containing dehydrogenase